MGKRASISFRDDEEDLWDWVEKMHQEGDFRSRSAVIIKCIKVGKRELDDSETFT